MPAAVIGPTANVLEEQRNIHRDKAHALLRYTEAVEDSNQRRRRASAAASKATAKDLGLLAHDLQSQVASLNNTPKPPPATTPQTIEALEEDIQNIVSALYQLRENAHLQYQILEMKYFELKRHAFDMEHQNRKLQLQVSDNPAHHHHNNNNNNNMQEALEAAQHEELTAQLQQENDDLRKQLRESCSECRKMVQENYGLRKILLDNGVHWNRSAEHANTAAGESKTEEEEDESDLMEEFEDAQEDFEDAQESFDAIPEETPTDILEEDVLTEDVSESILDMSTCDHSHVRKNVTPPPEEKPRAPVVTDDEGATEDTMSNEESSAEEEEKKEEFFQPLNDVSMSHQDLTTPPPKATMNPSYSSLCRTDSTDDSVTTAGTLSGSRRKRSSRKSATFAAMANRLAQANNSFQGDSDSVSTINTINVLRESYDQLQHERNLDLLGMGNVFSATPEKKESLTDKTNFNDSDRALGAPQEAAPPLRRVAYPSNGSSGTHKRLADFLGGSSERSTRSTRSHTIKPTTQAISARELMRKQKTGKKAINAKELMRKQGGGSKRRGSASSTDSSTFHIMMSSVAPPKSNPQVQVSDPAVEEARLSSLLGGFRSGGSSHNAMPSSSSTAAQVSRKAGSDEDSDPVSKGSSNHRRPSLFRRRKSHRENNNYNDDDASVASTKSLGNIFRKQSSSKRKGQS